MTTLLFAGLIFLLAGLVQGLTGFGSALVAIPLLSLIMDVKAAVPLCMANGLVITWYLVVRLRAHLDPHKILPLALGSLPGIWLGATWLKSVDSGVIRFWLGALLAAYALYSLASRPRSLHPAPAWGYVAGFLTGTIGAAFSAGGPPSIIYTTLTGWKKEEIKATLSGFFVLNGMVTVVVHALTGVSSRQTAQAFLVTAPFVLLGTGIGSRLTDRIDGRTYLRLVHGFLIVMGVMLMAGS